MFITDCIVSQEKVFWIRVSDIVGIDWTTCWNAPRDDFTGEIIKLKIRNRTETIIPSVTIIKIVTRIYHYWFFYSTWT